MRLKRAYFAGAILVSVMPAAMADVVDGRVAQLAATVTIDDWGNTFDFTTDGSVRNEGGGTYSYAGSGTGADWDFDWALRANADPFIAGALTFVNTTSLTKNFNVVLSLPIIQEAGTVNETGELSLTLSDSDNSGSADLALNQWHGLINPLSGSPVLDMPLLGGSVFNCSGGPGCATSLFPLVSSQQHGSADHAGNPVDSIGIHLNFDLSPGDTVVFDTRYEIAAVPVPAASVLFMSGLVGLFGVLRRKSHFTGK